MIKIFGIVYSDKTTEYIPYINPATEKLWRFENNCLIDIIDHHVDDLADNDNLGVFSWKFKIKTGMSKSQLHRKIQDYPKAEVYNFSRPYADHYFFHGKRVPFNFMNWSDDGHKGIKGFIQRCCEHVGLTYTNDPKHIVYANQFVAKKFVYIAYVNEVIKPCLELLEGPMWEEVNKDAGYTKAMEASKLKDFTGLDFYNYIPFCLERMMSQYIFNKNLVCLDLNRR